jgi:hypothetical protein
MLINKAPLVRVKNPKQIPPPPHHLLFHLGFFFSPFFHMAGADGSRLDLGSPTVPRGHGRPRGSKNKTAPAAVGPSSPAPVEHHPGRPAGSKNKPKVTSTTPGPSAPPPGASPTSPEYFLSFASPMRSATRFSSSR